MGSNFFFGKGNQQDPFQSLAQGIMLGQHIVGNLNQAQTQDIKNQMLQNELDKQTAVKNALANYGQPGFNPADVIKADPALGLQLQNLMRSANKDQIEMLSAAASLGEKFAPLLLGNPKLYPTLIKNFEDIGIKNALPPWESFFDQSGNFKTKEFVSTIAQIGAGTKGLQDALKPKEPHFLPPAYDVQGNIIQNVVQPGSNQVTQLPGVKGGKEFTPQKFIDKDDPTKFEWVQPGQMPKNPNAVSETVYSQLLKMPEMSQETKMKYAKAYKLYGDSVLPKVTGFMGGKLLAEIQDIAMSNKGLENVDASDIINMMANRGDYEGLRNAQKKIETNYAVTRQSMDKANRHLDEAISAFNAVGNTGTPLVNDLINKGRRALTDDPRLARLDAALEVAIPEVTRAVTGLGGVVTDTAREHMYKVAHAAQAPQAFLSSAQTLKKIMEEVDASYKGEIGRLKGNIKGFGSANATETPATQTQPQIQPDQLKQFYDTNKAKIVNAPNLTPTQRQQKLKMLDDEYTKQGGKL